MNTIDQFLSKDGAYIKRQSRVEKFAALSKKCKTKKELRELERRLLKPEALPAYTHQTSTAKTIDDRVIEVVFQDNKTVELFKQFFETTGKRRTMKNVKQSVYKIDLLLVFLNALKNKEIEYNEKKKRLEYSTAFKCRNRKGGKSLVTRKQRKRTG